MRRAVVYINLDPCGRMKLADVEQAFARLIASGHQVIATELSQLPATRREIEVVLTGTDRAAITRRAIQACRAAMSDSVLAGSAEMGPSVVAVSFMSAGTQEDASAVLDALGFADHVRDLDLVDEENAVVALDADGYDHPSRAKVETALEAALNRAVRFTLHK